jgi:streptogramin lyase
MPLASGTPHIDGEPPQLLPANPGIVYFANPALKTKGRLNPYSSLGDKYPNIQGRVAG